MSTEKTKTIEDLEYTIISVGEPTLLDCTKSVLAQTYQASYHYAIFNTSPISAAINAYHLKMWKDFSIKVDADFILHDNCFEKLYKTMLKKGDKYYCISGLVEDPYFGPIGGIHLYRTRLVKNLTVPDRIGCDRFVREEMEKRGYRFHEIQEVLAEHRTDYDYKNVFARYFRAGQKHLFYGTRRHEDYIRNMGRKWINGGRRWVVNDDRMAFIGLCGYVLGLFTPDNREKGMGFARQEIRAMGELIDKGVVPKP